MAHLVSGRATELSEFEFGLTICEQRLPPLDGALHGGQRLPAPEPLDILVVHTVNHRDRAKKLADICLVLNVEDTHTVTYALRKLEKFSLVRGEKKGKEKAFSITPEGKSACQRYREIRDECPVKSLNLLGDANRGIGGLAGLLRALSGLYDQAARAATSL